MHNHRALPHLPPINPYGNREFGDLLIIEDDQPPPIADWITGGLITAITLVLVASEHVAIALDRAYGHGSQHGWSVNAPIWIAAGLGGIVFSFVYSWCRKSQPEYWNRNAARAFAITSVAVLPGHIAVLLTYLLFCVALNFEVPSP